MSVLPAGMLLAPVTGTMTDGHSDGKLFAGVSDDEEEEEGAEASSLPPSVGEAALASRVEVGKRSLSESVKVGLASRVEVGTHE